MRRTVLVLLLSGLLTGCFGGESTSVRPPTETPEATRVEMAIEMFDLAPFEAMAARAGELCAAAYTRVTRDGEPAAPLLVVKKDAGSQGSAWALDSLFKITPTILPYFPDAPGDVQTLVCVLETFTRVGGYESGAAAFRTDYDLRVVQWEDGTVIMAHSLEGGDPPGAVSAGADAGYGPPPGPAFLAWLDSVFGQ